jgi:flagellar protein FliL
MDVKFLGTIVFAVVNLLVTGGGVYLVFLSTMGFEPPQLRESELKEVRRLASLSKVGDDLPLVYTMEKLTANLAGEPKRAIQVEINVEMLNKDGFTEMLDSRRRAQVRDQVLRVLGNTTFSEVESIQGKLFLKDTFAQELNSILDKGVVKRIYFSHFVVN